MLPLFIVSGWVRSCVTRVLVANFISQPTRQDSFQPVNLSSSRPRRQSPETLLMNRSILFHYLRAIREIAVPQGPARRCCFIYRPTFSFSTFKNKIFLRKQSISSRSIGRGEEKREKEKVFQLFEIFSSRNAINENNGSSLGFYCFVQGRPFQGEN